MLHVRRNYENLSTQGLRLSTKHAQQT